MFSFNKNVFFCFQTRRSSTFARWRNTPTSPEGFRKTAGSSTRPSWCTSSSTSTAHATSKIRRPEKSSLSKTTIMKDLFLSETLWKYVDEKKNHFLKRLLWRRILFLSKTLWKLRKLKTINILLKTSQIQKRHCQTDNRVPWYIPV